MSLAAKARHLGKVPALKSFCFWPKFEPKVCLKPTSNRVVLLTGINLVCSKTLFSWTIGWKPLIDYYGVITIGNDFVSFGDKEIPLEPWRI